MGMRTYALVKSALCLAACTYALPAPAQIVPDGTLPANSIVAPNGNSFVIEGGTTSGANLFHSFSEFSLPTGSEAFFNNAQTIDNIITRVTGGNISEIDGLIRANGAANLFLINPSGIQFGPNASLNIGGSFLGSTADRVMFEDGSFFSATEANAPPLLTVNVPVGLQFGSNPDAIQVNGSGHRLSLNEVPFTSIVLIPAPLFVPNRTARPAGLQVPSGRTLALVGGDLTLAGGNLTAFGGRVELGSVAEPGMVLIKLKSNGFTFDYSNIKTFGDIHLAQAASIDTSGAGSGDLHIQGKTITLTETSTLLAQTLGERNGGSSRLRASESILFQGAASADLPTAWFNQVEAGATGNGGMLDIETRDLRVDTNAFISSATLSSGNAGDIELRTVTFEATKPFDLRAANITGLFATVFPGATGSGGNLTIQTEQFQASNLAFVETASLGAGNAGKFTLQAQDVEVSRFALVNTNVYSTGNAGDFEIQTERLRLLNGGQILASTFGAGDAGRLTIRASDIELLGFSRLTDVNLVGGLTFSGLFSGNQRGSTGNGNTMTIETNSLRLIDGGTIFLGVIGPGDGADLTIRAQDIEVSGAFVDFTDDQNGISVLVTTDASGRAGNLIIDTDRLRVTNGGLISSQTEGNANAGNIQISANSIEVSGSSVLRSATEDFGVVPSRIAASSTTEFAAGSVLLDTDVLQANNSGEITVSNIADGDAGNLNVTAGNIFLNTGGSLRAEVNGGSQGNINLNVSDALVLRRNSSIAANATGASTGGNINIDTNVLAALQNSRITANAIQGAGGNIQITTQGIFTSPDSSITASSEFGVNGIVQINNPDTDSTQALVELSQAPADKSDRIVTGCAATIEGSSFIVTGRGSLPPNPEEQLIGDRPWADLRDLSAFRGEVGQNISPEPVGGMERAIIEANAIRVNEQGEIELVAVVEASDPAVSSLPLDCEGNELAL